MQDALKEREGEEEIQQGVEDGEQQHQQAEVDVASDLVSDFINEHAKLQEESNDNSPISPLRISRYAHTRERGGWNEGRGEEIGGKKKGKTENRSILLSLVAAEQLACYPQQAALTIVVVVVVATARMNTVECFSLNKTLKNIQVIHDAAIAG